ncbi:hypothetical protein HN587_06955 [Candidatus Woesearchaeota archaeon]|jgi:chromosome segregation ATPase|nr:hypothetical protein [Candidatus Woesearchaeota archaeon]
MVGGKKQAKSRKKHSVEDSLTYTSVTKVRDFRELDGVLSNSFGNIKKDMRYLQETQTQQLTSTNEIKSLIKGMREDFVTVDKFNILKIKIAEINENLKKLWDLDKKVIELDSKSLAESDFDQQASLWENEFEKVRQDLEDLKDKSASEKQLKKLVQDINDEFDKVKENIDQIRNIKNTITRGELDKRTLMLNNQAEDLRTGLKKIEKRIKEKVSVKQAEELVDDINSEFDVVKETVENLKKDHAKFAKQKDLTSKFSSVGKDIKEIREEITSITQTHDTLLSKDEAENLIEDINTEFDIMKREVDKAFEQDKTIKKHFLRKTDFLDSEKNLRKEISDVEHGIKDVSQDVVELRTDLENQINERSTQEELNRDIRDTRDEIERLRKKINTVKDEVLSYKELKNMNKKLKYHLVKIQDNFVEEDKFEKLNEEVEMLKEQIQNSGMKLKKVKPSPVKKVSSRKQAQMRRKEELKTILKNEVKAKNGKKNYSALFFFANFLMTVAFILLIGSIGFFFWNQQLLTDSFAIAAVVCFVVGILIRILVLVKREG